MARPERTWTVATQTVSSIPAEETISPLDRPMSVGTMAHLGYGVIRPFRRDKKSDFANAGGMDLVRSCVGQILGTRSSSDFTQGEVPWRTDFGSVFYLLRHVQNDDGLQELARYYSKDALERWEPRVLIKRAMFERFDASGDGDNALRVMLKYDVTQYSTASNQVLLPDVTQVLNVQT